MPNQLPRHLKSATRFFPTMSESNEKYQKAELSTELSESTRTVIIKALQDGESAITIAKDLRTARSTVYRIKDRFQEHGDMSTRTRFGSTT